MQLLTEFLKLQFLQEKKLLRIISKISQINISRKIIVMKIIFFLAATMLAMAKFTGSKETIMSWLHSGRTAKQEYKIMGLMIEQYPISWNFDEDMTVGEYIEFHAESSGNYRVEIAFVTTKYSEEYIQKFAESIDNFVLQLQDENKLLSELKILD